MFSFFFFFFQRNTTSIGMQRRNKNVHRVLSLQGGFPPKRLGTSFLAGSALVPLLLARTWWQQFCLPKQQQMLYFIGTVVGQGEHRDPHRSLWGDLLRHVVMHKQVPSQRTPLPNKKNFKKRFRFMLGIKPCTLRIGSGCSPISPPLLRL